MYNYPGHQPSYGSYPGAAGAPPGLSGLGPPPAQGSGMEPFACTKGQFTDLMIAPGMSPPPGAAPPGMQQGQTPTRPGFPQGGLQGLQMPPNMPNINMNASVIRLGVPGKSDTPTQGNPGGDRNAPGRRAGLGAGSDYRGQDQQRQQMRETQMALAPPTREEIARTIFIGNITDGVDDDDLENILRTAGSLRRWIRAMDADNKPCSFGFAEYEDVDSLGAAAEIFKERDIEIPAAKQKPKVVKKEEGEDADTKEEESEPERTKLLVCC
jgi:hypothetical protein